jgi:hypothetical protein
MKSQKQIYYSEARKLSETNDSFLELAKDMTREELARNIERRPSLWGRFANWLNVLPSAIG